MNSRRPQGKRELPYLRIMFALFLALASFLGIAAIVFADIWGKKDTSPIPIILRDLGISVVVSVLVATFVEFYTGRTLRTEVATDVIGATFKRFVPPSIYDEIADHVLKANVLREGWEIRLDLVEPQVENEMYTRARELAGEDIYLVNSTVSYQLTSTSSKPVNYEVTGSIDLDTPLSEIAIPRFTEICIDGQKVVVDKAVGEAALRGENCRLGTCLLKRTGGQVHFVKRCSIPPAGFVDVRFKVLRAFRAPGQVIFSATAPARKMRLQIHGSPPLEFELIALHPNKDGLRIVADREWEFDLGILPWQGFALRANPPTSPSRSGGGGHGLWVISPNESS